MTAIVGLVAGIALGAAGAWLVLRERLRALLAELARERAGAEEKTALLGGTRTDLAHTIKALAADALRSNNESFLELARTQLEQKEKAVEHLVEPIKASLERVSGEVNKLELNRRRDVGELTRHLRDVAQTSERVRVEAASLTTALRASEVRGAWGEMQLRNAVESAGMLAYCDFVEQVTTAGDGRVYRPDLVVRLPGGRHVVVDAKAPLKPLLDAAGATDDEAREHAMREFGRHVRQHIASLEAKAYWQQFDTTPDFVVMFLPGESFFRAAVEQEPSLLQNRRVQIASPMTLISLLRTIANVWREEKVAESAAAVSETGRVLYERLITMSDHYVTLGRRLDGAVQAYNQSVGSFERRVLPQARRFVELGVNVSKELPSPAPVDRAAQPPQTAELPARAAEPPPPAADAA
jgi:DNA recombination protein RmuC